ncbi:TPA: hypothetical protein ACNEZX_004347 [Escherichia coli]
MLRLIFIGGQERGLIDVSEEIKKLPEEAVFEIHAGQMIIWLCRHIHQ